eukprot:1069397-Prymnesium_polylepis.1
MVQEVLSTSQATAESEEAAIGGVEVFNEFVASPGLSAEPAGTGSCRATACDENWGGDDAGVTQHTVGERWARGGGNRRS